MIRQINSCCATRIAILAIWIISLFGSPNPAIAQDQTPAETQARQARARAAARNRTARPGVLRRSDLSQKVDPATRQSIGRGIPSHSSVPDSPDALAAPSVTTGSGVLPGVSPATMPATMPGMMPPGAPGTGTAVGAPGDTPWSKVNMPQELETGIEFRRPRRNAQFSFNLVDADLVELIKIIGNITGKAFILGAKVPRIKATVYAPTKINAEEAYQVFLSVLQVNGLTVMPAGRYLKIVTIGGSTGQNTPIYNRETVPGGDQIVTRLYHLEYISAEDLTPVLDRFKSTEGDITVYAPTNMLIITDYGASIRRLLKLISVLDAPGTGEQIWIEPINYANASDMAQSIVDVFDVSDSAKKSTPGKTMGKGQSKAKRAPAGAAASVVVGEEVGDSTISKILPDERTNSLIIVASESAYLRILELIKRLDVPIEGEGTLHVVKLQHTDAEELAKTLSGLTKSSRTSTKKSKGAQGGGGGESASLFEGDVQVSADKTTNSLLVVASLRDYMSLKAVVDKLDVVQQQVFVEAVLMEVGINSQLDLGFSFHGGKVVNGKNGNSLLYSSVKPGDVDSMSLSTAMLPGLATGMIGPSIPEAQDLVGVSIPAFGVALQAMQTNSDANVLATPNIIATDNKEATIQVGENVPISMGYSPGGSLLTQAAASATNNAGIDASDLSSAIGGLGGVRYKRQDVGLTLKITPHINDSQQVRLDIDIEATAITSVDPTAGPNISKKKATTTSVVADQQTVVIGGLITDNDTQTTKKVPFFGDIPILGFLFRSKTTVKKKQNLLIFLTPYIIRSEEDFRHIFTRKMAERREFIERWTVFENHRVDPYLDWSRTSGVVSEINHVVQRTQEDEELRRQSQLLTDVEHTRKEPLGGDSGASTEEQEAPPAAVISIKQLLSESDNEAAVSNADGWAASPSEASPPPAERDAAAPPASGDKTNVPFEMEVVE